MTVKNTDVVVYNKEMESCLFCKIIAGEIPSTKVYEDDTILAFLDIHPVNIGHTLVIPKAHHVNLYDASDETLAQMMPIIKKLSIAVKSALKADGINIEMNNDAPAGQLIFHTHIHIIPRFSNDGFRFGWRKLEYKESEMDRFQKKIRSFL